VGECLALARAWRWIPGCHPDDKTQRPDQFDIIEAGVSDGCTMTARKCASAPSSSSKTERGAVINVSTLTAAQRTDVLNTL
jgi:hypothetical protein